MDRPRPPGRTNCAVVFIQAGPSSRTWDSCGCGGLRAAAAQRAHDHGNVRACLRVSEREDLGRWRARAHPPAPRTGVYVVGRLPNAMPAIQRRRIGRALSRRRRALAYRSVALHRSLWAANGIVLDARRRRCPHPAQPRRRRAVGPWSIILRTWRRKWCISVSLGERGPGRNPCFGLPRGARRGLDVGWSVTVGLLVGLPTAHPHSRHASAPPRGRQSRRLDDLGLSHRSGRAGCFWW